MRVSSIFAGAVGAALLAASPASASIMMATFTGATDFGGYDYGGIFGPAGASLAYKNMSLTFTYDTEKGELIGGGAETRYGGTMWGTVSPILSAAITIGDVTQALDLSYYGYASSYAGEWTWLSGRQETPGNNPGELQAVVYHDAPGDLDTPFFAYADGGGSLRLYKPDDYGEVLAETDFYFGGVEVTYLGPSPSPSAAPEPATWALLIAGFGLAGAALRRRRHAPGVARLS